MRTNHLKTLSENSFILCPKFILLNQNGNEYVFLDHNQKVIKEINEELFPNRTAIEALENHFHIFDKVSNEDIEYIKEISIKISKNLKNTLEKQFPTKRFVVYLQLDYKDSIIIRFHQIWKNEEIYFSYDDLKDEYDSEKIMKF